MAVGRIGLRTTPRYREIRVDGLLTEAAGRWPDKVAVIDGDRRTSFSELEDSSSRLASALAASGVAKGDRVGLLAPNCTEYVVAFFGVIRSGAVVTTLNAGYREREIAHQLNDNGSSVLIVHESLLPVVESARPEIPALERLIVIGDGSSHESLQDLIERGDPSPPQVEIDPREDLAVLPYSSGTTGLAKGVMLTHFNLTANVQQFLERGGEEGELRHDDVILVHLPLFQIYGMNVLMVPAIVVGATQVMMGRFDMDQFLGLLSAHRVTILATVPPVALGITQYPGVADHDLTALRYAVVAAAPSSADLQRRMGEAIGCPVIQGYGMTELSPVSHIDYVEEALREPGSVGLPVGDTGARVVDLEDGETDVPAGEIGELMVRGPQVMKGYYDNPEATAETITPAGWLHTGDIVRMNAVGRLWILDRKKELIKYKGFQVPPAELEALLLEHPAVRDVAVIGKPDEEAGEVPKAFVVPHDGVETPVDELMSFVAERVATFKQVREVELVDEIPRNPSGKILRRVLAEGERSATPAS